MLLPVCSIHYMFSLYEGYLIPWKCMFENVLLVSKIKKQNNFLPRPTVNYAQT